VSEITELLREHNKIRAYQGEVTSNLGVVFSTIIARIQKAQALGDEELLRYANRVITMTNKAEEKYLSLLTAILDQLEAEDNG
jgi:hypothetical protein